MIMICHQSLNLLLPMTDRKKKNDDSSGKPTYHAASGDIVRDNNQTYPQAHQQGSILN